ncbi:hypothetical protein SAMN02910358_01039 [Lachnospiraceae bacterium XBB1006]|nr:hypothetical protein SAMN02910358_01039 [Lachnospiraceae bacterium XBB1006]
MGKLTFHRSQSGEFTISDLNEVLTAESKPMEKYATGITIGAVAFLTISLIFAGFIL